MHVSRRTRVLLLSECCVFLCVVRQRHVIHQNPRFVPDAFSELRPMRHLLARCLALLLCATTVPQRAHQASSKLARVLWGTTKERRVESRKSAATAAFSVASSRLRMLPRGQLGYLKGVAEGPHARCKPQT